ncbi:ErmE/ErmH/ErmO/ErmR family 23S rRNA (adenine(2058)-N(6))-methyltransferase [Nocardia sp. NPDC024068]|uniref:ErmE/ErmH/ErmO/ErmR family 23S rRNA (adenine(2058)-N(6))-methyltransferase n=1 Tax=Nocardia sp. NPDC024068 TaxID=3157197 RepID=UPI0033FB9856
MSRHDRHSPARISATRKRLSQNFLTDPATARRIVRSSGIGRDDLVLEIGPGDGTLTRPLLDRAGRVLAYEKDRRYARRLAVRYAENPRFHVVHSDFRAAAPPDRPFAVVANVPFAVTTDIVRWCLAARHLSSATLLTQYEFARKHTGDYGRWSKLTVTHWPDTEFALGHRLDRREFSPVPRVDAALLRIVPRTEPLLPEHIRNRYRRLVDLGFSGVGGSFAASLRRAHPARAVAAACAAAGIPADVPVGFVAPGSWLIVFRLLDGGDTGGSTPRAARETSRRSR